MLHFGQVWLVFMGKAKIASSLADAHRAKQRDRTGDDVTRRGADAKAKEIARTHPPRVTGIVPREEGRVVAQRDAHVLVDVVRVIERLEHVRLAAREHADVEARLFAELSHDGVLETLAALDVTSRERPFACARRTRAPDHEDAPVPANDDGADGLHAFHGSCERTLPRVLSMRER